MDARGLTLNEANQLKAERKARERAATRRKKQEAEVKRLQPVEPEVIEAEIITPAPSFRSLETPEDRGIILNWFKRWGVESATKLYSAYNDKMNEVSRARSIHLDMVNQEITLKEKGVYMEFLEGIERARGELTTTEFNKQIAELAAHIRVSDSIMNKKEEVKALPPEIKQDAIIQADIQKESNEDTQYHNIDVGNVDVSEGDCKEKKDLPIQVLGTTDQGVTYIESSMRYRPLYVLGEPGTGKSSLINRMAIADIEAGCGVMVIDPHGDLTKNILGCVPEERQKDVIYFSVDSPIAYNVLHTDTNNVSRLINEFIELLDKMHPTQPLTSRMRSWLRRCLRVLTLKPDVTIKDIEAFFTIKEFRVDLLDELKIADKVMLSLWKSDGIFDKAMNRDLRVTIDGILDRIEELVMDERVERITCRPNELDFNEIVEGKIFLANLSKLEETLQRFIGGFLVHGIKTKLLGKPEEERKPLSLYVDEFHNFVNPDFNRLLPEGRKFLISICLAHQNHTLVPDTLLGTIMATTTNKVIFRCGDGRDAARMAGSCVDFQKEDILGLPDHKALCKTLERKEVKETLISTIPEPKGRPVELPKKDTPPQEPALQVVKDEIGCGWMPTVEDEGSEVAEEIREEEVV